MIDEKIIMFRHRLEKVYRHLGRQARRMGISCYRIYDHDLLEFPFCIELYGNKLYVAEYKRRHGMTTQEHDDWIEKSLGIMIEVLGVAKENIFLKLRRQKPGRMGQYQKYGEVQHEFVVEENGLKFMVNLSDYLDTGLFLDHRVTRQMVRDQSAGKKVLNLFAYTGSFSVYAMAGGAKEIVTVDLSKTYLSWAEKNFLINGFLINNSPPAGGAKVEFIHADVKPYLKTLPAAYFDLIIMDSPTFSNSKRMDDFLDIQRDHVELINDGLNGLKKGGTFYFSTNYKKFILDKNKITASTINDITKTTTPFDFEGKLFRYCYTIMK